MGDSAFPDAAIDPNLLLLSLDDVDPADGPSSIAGPSRTTILGAIDPEALDDLEVAGDEEAGDASSPSKARGHRRAHNSPPHTARDNARRPSDAVDASRRRGKSRPAAPVDAAEEDGDESDGADQVMRRIVARVANGPAPGGGDGDIHLVETADAEDGPPVAKRAYRKRKVHKPTHEVAVLLAKADDASRHGQFATAVDLFLEAFKTDMSVAAAFQTLSRCYEGLGNLTEARMMKFCGLHLECEPGDWRRMAEEFREMGAPDEVLYCLRQSLRQDPTEVLTLWEVAAEYRRRGKANYAIDAFRRMLRCDPTSAHDFMILMEFYPLYLSSPVQLKRGVEILRPAFDWHLAKFSGPGSGLTTEREHNTMVLGHVIALVSLLYRVGEYEEVVVTVKRGQRWLQERKDQEIFDTLEDDREYDAPGTKRDGLRGQERLGSFDLDMRLRHWLAMARLLMGDDAEAERHVAVLQQYDPLLHPGMLLELANTLMQREKWQLAHDCYMPIANHDSDQVYLDPDSYYNLALCQIELGDKENAMSILQHVIEQAPTNYKAYLRLSELLAEIGEHERAMQLVSEVMKARGKDGHDRRRALPDLLTPAERVSRADRAAQNRLNKTVFRDQMRQHMENLWEDVRDTEEGIAAGDMGQLDKFMLAAGSLVETFRMAKSNFGKGRGVTRVAVRRRGEDIGAQAEALQDTLERRREVEGSEAVDGDMELEEELNPTYITKRQGSFYGEGREAWLGLIIKYCCVLCVKQEPKLAVEIAEHALVAGLFNHKRAEIALRLTVIACALRIREYGKVADSCRRLAQMHQFRTEPFQLLLACLGGGGLAAAAAWQDRTLQKFLLRELRLYELAARGGRFHYSVTHGRWTQEKQLGLSEGLGDRIEWEGEEGAWRKGSRYAVAPVPTSGARGGGQGRGRDVDMSAEEEDEEEEEEMNGQPRASSAAASPLGEEHGPVAIENYPPKPTTWSPVFNTLYAQTMLTARSHHTALFYLMRAFEQNPYDPLICLLIAQAYLARSLNRQADNKNQFIAQALAFLERYRKLSPSDAISQEEVEYNYGRAFHHAGVQHLAARHYERVLASVEQRMAAAGEELVSRRKKKEIDKERNPERFPESDSDSDSDSDSTSDEMETEDSEDDTEWDWPSSSGEEEEMGGWRRPRRDVRRGRKSEQQERGLSGSRSRATSASESGNAHVRAQTQSRAQTQTQSQSRAPTGSRPGSRLESVKMEEGEEVPPQYIRQSSLAYEAAHNLMLIYAASGSDALVRDKSRWLAL